MLKVLVIGVGSHAQQSHIKFLSKHPDVELIGYVDPNPENAEKAIEEYGLEDFIPFETVEQGLKCADAVVISSPDRFHLPQMKLAIGHRCHVFCEKPLASSMDEYDELKVIFDMADKYGLTITTCHPRRFDPVYVALKECLKGYTQLYGKVLSVKLDFSYHKPSKTGLHGGSMLQDHANHEIDYLFYLLGDSSFDAYKLWDEEDRYEMSGIRADGVKFEFGGTRRLNTKIYPETVVIRFERGEAFVDTKVEANSYFFDHETREKKPLQLGVTDYEKRFSALNQHWLDVVAGKADNYVSQKQMLLNTEMSVVFQKQKIFSYDPE